MDKMTIVCPKCGVEIDLTDAIMMPLRESIRKELGKKEEQKAKHDVVLEIDDMKAQLKEKEKLLEKAHNHELELRKQRRELEEKAKNLELENARTLDAEREKIREEATRKTMADYHLQSKDKDALIDTLKKQIEVLKNKADQGSQQLQGEVLEVELEDQLRECFPDDHIKPVKPGTKGADVIQSVFTRSGRPCGSIIWESKRTTNWSDGWISKLNDDKRREGADIAAIVTMTLPKGVASVGSVSGVVIADYQSFVPVASLLRRQLIEIAGAKQYTVDRNEKMQVLYDYVSGKEFTHKVEAVVEAFTNMKKDLDKEKMSITKLWAKREKEMERVAASIGTMLGNMHGIVGASFPEIKALELKELPSGDEDESTSD